MYYRINRMSNNMFVKLVLCFISCAIFAAPLVAGFALNAHEMYNNGRKWISQGTKLFQNSPINLGSCPQKGSYSEASFSLEPGKYYTYAVSGQLSPLYYLTCQTHEIIALSEDEHQVSSSFRLPRIAYDFEMVGMSAKDSVNNMMHIMYSTPGLGNIKQSFNVLASVGSEAALLWSCMDFKLFNVQTAVVLTKFNTLTQNAGVSEFMSQLNTIMLENNLDPTSLKPVAHDQCH